MQIKYHAVLLAFFFVTPAHAGGMSATFSWSGIPACSTISPAFRVTNTPRSTVSLRFTLKDLDAPSFNHGGSTIAFDRKDKVAKGAITYKGPCPPRGRSHMYEWTIEALDNTGIVIDSFEAARPFSR